MPKLDRPFSINVNTRNSNTNQTPAPYRPVTAAEITVGQYIDGKRTESLVPSLSVQAWLEFLTDQRVSRYGDTLAEGYTIELGRDAESDMEAVTLQQLNSRLSSSTQGISVDLRVDNLSGVTHFVARPDFIRIGPPTSPGITYDKTDDDQVRVSIETIYPSIVGNVANKDSVVTITATYTVLPKDHIVICNNTSTATINLFAATGSGRVRFVKRINSGSVTIDASGAETIDGSTTLSLDANQSVALVDYASGKWAIIAQYTELTV